MIKYLLTGLCLVFSLSLQAQTIDFEDVTIPDEGYLKDAMNPEGFDLGDITLNNRFDIFPTFSAWTGWILSKGADSVTPGFGNEHSSITGGGSDGSDQYAVSFIGGRNVIKVNIEQGSFISSIDMTNNTYAALSMRDGDGFAKKFGGEDGNDPDFYRIKIFGYCNDQGQNIVDSMEYYLADYRFDDNNEDYIVDTWETIDVSPVFACDSIVMEPESSDVGAFGINTPTYVCIDNIVLDFYLDAQEVLSPTESFTLEQNMTMELLNINVHASDGWLQVIDQSGHTISRVNVSKGVRTMNVSTYQPGIYYLNFVDESGNQNTQRFVKL